LVLDTHDRDRHRGELAPNFDAADLELMLEQREYVGDDGVQVDALWLVRFSTLSRQTKQAIDDLRRAEGLPLDLLEQPRLRIARVGSFEQYLGEARDAGQRRVD
jgi:hypothetical protein